MQREVTDVARDREPDWIGLAKFGLDWLLNEKPGLPVPKPVFRLI